MFRHHSIRSWTIDQYNLVGVYGIMCETNRQLYVGRAQNIGNRWKQHIYQLDSGRHKSGAMFGHYHRYGPGNFLFFTIELVGRKDIQVDPGEEWAVKGAIKEKLLEIGKFYIYVTKSDVGYSRYNMHGNKALRALKHNPYDERFRRERANAMTEEARLLITEATVLGTSLSVPPEQARSPDPLSVQFERDWMPEPHPEPEGQKSQNGWYRSI
jgi:predicted GIY-YIG superfamily endonuclease